MGSDLGLIKIRDFGYCVRICFTIALIGVKLRILNALHLWPTMEIF